MTKYLFCFNNLLFLAYPLLYYYYYSTFHSSSIHVWDVSDLNSIIPFRSHYYHSRGIWSIDCTLSLKSIDPNLMDQSDQFITCSDDGTIRFWNLIPNNQSFKFDSTNHRSFQTYPPNTNVGENNRMCSSVIVDRLDSDPLVTNAKTKSQHHCIEVGFGNILFLISLLN